ncbi:HAD-IB family hydrolase, partial [Rhodococcus erythropolis]|nr:HAD-IB family hydrolase [Rhodococcus erythropolis]
MTDKPANGLNTGRTAAFFDLDKTIIAKSSTLAFSKPFFAQGLINR